MSVCRDFWNLPCFIKIYKFNFVIKKISFDDYVEKFWNLPCFMKIYCILKIRVTLSRKLGLMIVCREVLESSMLLENLLFIRNKFNFVIKKISIDEYVEKFWNLPCSMLIYWVHAS